MSFLPCSFDDLKKRDGPPLQAWGLFGDNELGRLNLITPEAVKRGRDAIQHGVAVNLNLPLTSFPPINPTRGCFKHEIIAHANFTDDHVSYNTQCSTQWDGFRHVPMQNYPEKGQYVYHAGMTTEQAQDPNYHHYGTGNFAKNPITTRAHLLDIVSWLEKTGGKPLEGCKNTTPITLTHLKQCAADYGVKFAPGDLLIVRSGFTEAFLALTDEERANYSPLNGAVGVEASEEVMRWIWEQGFAAVAGDTFAFESWPPPGFVKPEKGKISLHECFLSSWGLPIGELFDLRELSQKCAQYNKWTFFFSSMTLPVDAGIGSPANAQAVL